MSESSNPSACPGPIPLDQHPALLRARGLGRYWASVTSRALSETGRFFIGTNKPYWFQSSSASDCCLDSMYYGESKCWIK